MGALFKMFRFLKQYIPEAVIALLLIIFSQALILFQPKIIEFIIDNGFKNKDLVITLCGAGGILLAALLSLALECGGGYLRIKAAQGVAYDIRNTLYKKIMSFSFSILDKWRTGELIVRSTSDVTTITQFIRMGVFIFIQALIMLSGCLVFMFLTHIRLALIMVIVLPLVFVLFIFFAIMIKPLFLIVRKKLDVLNNILQENLAGAKIVRAFARQSFEIGKFRNNNELFLKRSLKVGYIISIAFPFLFLAGNCILTVTLWVGGKLVIENLLSPSEFGLTMGKFVAFMNYAGMAVFPILMLGMILSFISMAAASASRIDELFQEKSMLLEKKNARSVKSLNGKIEFHNVSFHYGNGENVLSQVNLVIHPGEKIGILGTTGSGKSTLVHLIPRFFDPTGGGISINGIDVQDLSFQTLRTRIAIVFQEIVLFSGSIKDNILFGNPSMTDDEIMHAARVACAEEFILKKDTHWDTAVGERGIGLSGGQRQRLAIARAVSTKPDILILDDVTSSVDADTEKKLIHNLFSELREKTLIIISQKIITVQNTDRIIIMDKGKIMGAGSHKELLGSNKIYQEIFDTQNAELYT